MDVSIFPGKLNGTITAPTSKSAAQRALALALLHNGVTILKGLGSSNDEMAALSAIKMLGANVEELPDGRLKITCDGKIKPLSSEVNFGESGLATRMFTPLIALSNNQFVVNGKGSLLTRPMDFFQEVLQKLNVQIKSTKGVLPLHIQGPLQPKNISVDGSMSSQYITGLLMAFAKATEMPVEILVENPVSKPYISLTLSLMQHFGYSVEEKNNRYIISPGSTKTGEEINYSIEGDWSGAAFLLVSGAVNGDIAVKNLDLNSAQADKAILNALGEAGAIMSIAEEEIKVEKSSLKPFYFNATDCPDLFPPLVALAAYCNGKSVIEGAGRLTHKESNRAATLQAEFGKMGLDIALQDDLMIVEGTGIIKTAKVSSCNDHRIAMAAAVAALGAEGKIDIENAEAIDKSYPLFYKDLESCGINITYIHE